jgi:hypothetical protein
MTDIYAKCPKCDNRLNISQQLRDVLAEMAELAQPKLAQNTLPDTMIASIWCEQCEEYTLVLSLGRRDESMLVKVEETINKKARLTSKKHVS